MKVGQSGGRLWGMAVGVTVTLIVLIAQQRGWLDRVSAAGGDWHFRYANSIEASDEIVMIDINDYALERIHAWPWPRSLHADLINTLHDLGASAILLDLVFSEPTAARIVHPVLEADGDVDRPTEVLGEVDLSDAVRDDDLLAAAMHRAGNAYPAMYFQLARPGVDMPGLLWTAGELLRSAPETTPTALRNRVGLPPDIDARQFHTRARLVGVLAEDFTPDAAEVAERLKMPLDSVDRYLAKMKQFVVRRRVAEYLRTAPEAGFAEVRRHFLPDLAADQKSPERQELLRAYRAGRALALVGAHAPDMPAGLIDHVPHGWDATPPLDKFAKTARAAGLVTFQKDAAGGVLRRVPLLVHFAGKQIRQLGFAVACDFLEIDTERITREGNHLVMSDRRGERSWRIPLDDRGMTVLNWHVDPHRPEWPHSFTHIAVSRVMEIALNRKAIAQNEALLALRTFSAVQLRFADQPASCRDYAGWVRARAALEGNPDATVDERRLLDEQIQEVERATLEWLAFAVRSIADLEPESEEEAREFALFRGLKADLVDGRLSERIEQENAALRTRNTAILDQLRPLINNRLCLVGYTAAAVADMVNSPVFESMPGVMAHANVINTVIQNRFPQVAPASMTTALLLLGGLLMTAIAAHRGPWASLVSLFTLIAVLLVGGAALFRYGDYIVASIVPALTVFVSWAFVTLYRQLTEERHRRNLTKALGRSTSPAIAAEILRRRGAVDLSPRPAQVSCYFSDLQGFTDLSERLGPEDTQAVLNRYLEQMSGVLVPSHAFCKFMGDGIFAFFNAPLLPVKHHEAGACEVALRCVEALEQLKREQAMGEQGDVFAGLFMRAGVHAGTTYVGEFGSENQTDYTCIGDTVNLAARLEPANKAYGTQILVSSATRDVVGDAYEFRPLGKLQVKGKQHAVGVHELLGRRGEVDESRIAHARLFAGAIALFQERRFVEARQILASCEAERPHDPAAALYAAEIERHLASPPDSAWNQAIQLTTK